MASVNEDVRPIEVQPRDVADRLRRGECVLVDVREDFERSEEWIDGSAHRPLGRLDVAALQEEHAGRTLIFVCRSGSRARKACEHMIRECGQPGYALAGGLEGWKQAGQATRRASGGGIGVMRQVQIVAGGLVLAGVLLSVTLTPWFLALSAFVGAGLVFAGSTGWCGMAILLGRMPWNRPGGGGSGGTCDGGQRSAKRV